MESICKTAAAPKRAAVSVKVMRLMCFRHSVSRNSAAAAAPSQMDWSCFTKHCMMLLLITTHASAKSASCRYVNHGISGKAVLSAASGSANRPWM